MTDAEQRRRLLRGLLAGGGAALLSGCEKLNNTPSFRALLERADGPTEAALRALTPDDALAEEFTRADLSPVFKANGSIDPRTPEYLALKATGFADYRLEVRGRVRKPLSLSLAQLRARPARTQTKGRECNLHRIHVADHACTPRDSALASLASQIKWMWFDSTLNSQIRNLGPWLAAMQPRTTANTFARGA